MPPRQEYIEQAPIVVELTIEEYAKQEVTEAWSEAEWESFNKIIIKESGWKPTAQNPKSTAYGLCQRMMSLYTEDSDSYRTDPKAQVNWCVGYIKDRYATPSRALEFHHKNNWF